MLPRATPRLFVLGAVFAAFLISDVSAPASFGSVPTAEARSRKARRKAKRKARKERRQRGKLGRYKTRRGRKGRRLKRRKGRVEKRCKRGRCNKRRRRRLQRKIEEHGKRTACEDKIIAKWGTIRQKLSGRMKRKVVPPRRFLRRSCKASKGKFSKIAQKLLGRLLPPILKGVFRRFKGRGGVKQILALISARLGNPNVLATNVGHMTKMLTLLKSKDRSRFGSELERMGKKLQGWANLSLATVARIFVDWVKVKIKKKLFDKLGRILHKALDKVIQVVVTAIRSAILAAAGSVPFGGGALAVLGSLVVDVIIGMLKTRLIDFVLDKVGRLADKLVGFLGGFLIKGARRLDQLSSGVRNVMATIGNVLKGLMQQSHRALEPLRRNLKSYQNALRSLRASVR